MVVEITDPAVASRGVEFIDLDAVQLTSAPFRARRVIVRLEGAVVVYQATNHRVRARSKTQELLAYVTFGPRTKGTVNGLPIRPELMLAVQPGTEALLVPESAYESISLLFPPADIEAQLRARQRKEDFRFPHGVEILQSSAFPVRRLFRWGKRLVEAAARRPALFDDRRDVRIAAREEMVETLLSTLGATREYEPARTGRARQERARIVRKAEDYVLAHTGDRVYVGDLCRATGVSERALEYAFRDVMGMTPVAHLARIRLHRVRKALLAAAPGSTTVTAAALDWGFWRFGEFARAYKDCFGELPSATLRREPGRKARR
jgi:AraC family transcriptional regulator, ethanolamine operon transcriptional activator